MTGESARIERTTRSLITMFENRGMSRQAAKDAVMQIPPYQRSIRKYQELHAMSHRLSLRIPNWMMAAIKRTAQAAHKSEAQVVREIVRERYIG